jgi:hypothetical protein
MVLFNSNNPDSYRTYRCLLRYVASRAHTDANGDAYADANTNSYAYTHAHTDAHRITYAYAYGYTDAYADANTNSYAYAASNREDRVCRSMGYHGADVGSAWFLRNPRLADDVSGL